MSRTEVHIDHRPMIIVQIAPDHHTGARCRLWGCGDTIKPYSYRLAIRPGMENFRHSPDYFHVECLEKLLDLSSPDILPRLLPEYIANRDYDYLLDSGARFIVVEWIKRVEKVLEEGQAGEDPALATKEPVGSSKSPAHQEETTKIAPREGLQMTIDEADSKVAGPSTVVAAEKDDLSLTSPFHGKKRRHSPSSGGFKRRKTDDELIGDQIRALNQQTQDGEQKRPLDPAVLEEIANRSVSTDNEYGSDDEVAQPWEIFDYLPSTEDADLRDRHALSSALMRWKFEKFLAKTEDSELPERCIEDKQRLGKKTIEAIRPKSFVIVCVVPEENGSVKPGEYYIDLVWYHDCPTSSKEFTDFMNYIHVHRHLSTLPPGEISPGVWEKQQAYGQSILAAPIRELVDKGSLLLLATFKQQKLLSSTKSSYSSVMRSHCSDRT
ncbi:hypothetical protein OEA41_010385 [Lepraria neglecta]|uniref:2,6-dihydroxypyridine 3-monooxygenase substrate binding domain-containing protein n=1 Tax=Lepraria neglecta TaxID=209136 RepID=A0AAE0DF89_9LECA|nr:hypothetical protein OEA41_010385 [Lepraria neglecta]